MYNRGILFLVGALLCASLSAQATVTLEPAWEDEQSQTVFYQNDVPETKIFYYFPKFKIVPYIGGSHEFFDRSSYRSVWSLGINKYYQYRLRVLKYMDSEVLKSAKIALGPESLLMEIPIEEYRHVASRLPNRPYHSVEVTPNDGVGPYLNAEMDFIFTVRPGAKKRFEDYLTSDIGLSLDFDLTLRSAKKIYYGVIELNAKDLYYELHSRIQLRETSPTPEEISAILLELKEQSPGLWNIYQVKDKAYEARAQEMEQIFLKALEVLKSYYFNVNEQGELVQKRDEALGESVSLVLSDSVYELLEDVRFTFFVKLPEGTQIDPPASVEKKKEGENAVGLSE
ncbi:MAG: hypothetical protein A3B70_01780 [Deltaproteobacteria bacterium RIFCSPHIGHO2_02_FULL_40_11]|nr:MAG: hypothetical protein A3B70_01780 [Deltaproteobacteria bacterium RIFCSPHIGHO2_02_FULL_40_11]